MKNYLERLRYPQGPNPDEKVIDETTGEARTRILLVGIWGAGKTTLGNLLAQKLNWQMQDADTIIDSYVESIVTGNGAALEERSRRLKEVLEDETIGSLIIPTSMRPLLGEDGRLPPSTERAVTASSCVVIEIRRDPAEVARLFYENPDEKVKRPHLIGDTVAQLTVELTELEQTLRPLYERYRDCTIPAGLNAEERMTILLGELARFGINGQPGDERITFPKQ